MTMCFFEAVGIFANRHQTTAGEVLYADVLLLPNGMSKVGTT
jgi:hypothetical protein